MNRKLKALLIKNGVKQTEIAKLAGVARSTVSCVLGGHEKSRPIMQATAKLLKMPVERLEKMWSRNKAA